MRELWRAVGALIHLLVIASPVLLGLAATFSILLWWPGPLIGVGLLVGVAWLAERYAGRVGREHYW